MPLEIGTRLAHYDVTALIGEGGMGQVDQGHRYEPGHRVPAMRVAMKQASSTATRVGWVLRASGALAMIVGSALWFIPAEAQSSLQGPTYRVDPFWPKPLPTVTDRDGLSHQWVTGMVGASCIDSHDHIITVNRGFLPNGLLREQPHLDT